MWNVFETFGNCDYDGSRDYDINKWGNISFLEQRYTQYNKTYFESGLPSYIPISFGLEGKRALTSVIPHLQDSESKEILDDLPENLWNKDIHKMVATEIIFRKIHWGSRFQLENILIHELCHVWQIYKGIEQNPFDYMIEILHDRGHGPKFKFIGSIVTEMSKFNEGFVVQTHVSSSRDEYKPYPDA